MSAHYHILYKGKVKSFDSIESYIKWAHANLANLEEIGKENKVVAHDLIGSVLVSTVLVLTGPMEPLPTFETAVFFNNADNDWETWNKYSSIEDAVQGHQEVVQSIIDNRLKYVMFYKVAVPRRVTSLYRNPYIQQHRDCEKNRKWRQV